MEPILAGCRRTMGSFAHGTHSALTSIPHRYQQRKNANFLQQRIAKPILSKRIEQPVDRAAQIFVGPAKIFNLVD